MEEHKIHLNPEGPSFYVELENKPTGLDDMVDKQVRDRLVELSIDIQSISSDEAIGVVRWGPGNVSETLEVSLYSHGEWFTRDKNCGYPTSNT